MPFFLTLLIAVATSTRYCREASVNEGLHHSRSGVDDFTWYSREQINMRTGSHRDPDSPRLPDVTTGDFDVKIVTEMGVGYTCLTAGQKVTSLTGLETYECLPHDVATVDTVAAVTNGVETAVKMLKTTKITPVKTEEDGLDVARGLDRVDCSVKGRGSPLTFDSSRAPEADFLLYVVMTPFPFVNRSFAMGWPCYFAPITHRPTIGVLAVPPSTLKNLTMNYLSTILLHELLHALGVYPPLFTSDGGLGNLPTFLNNWVYYKDLNKTVARKILGSNVVVTKERVTGSEAFDFSVEGDPVVPDLVSYIVTPGVVEVTQRHFNCSEVPGLEIEDYSFGLSPPTTYAIHWEKRLTPHEILTSVVSPTARLSPFTTSLLQDTGFYIIPTPPPNLPYGANSTCHLLTTPCMDWHLTPGPHREYTCLPEYINATLGAGCPSGDTCLSTCTSYTAPEVVSRCTGGVLSQSSLLPLEYLSRSVYRGDGAVFGSAGEARGHGGCDPVADYCYLWEDDDTGGCAREMEGEDCWEGKCRVYHDYRGGTGCVAGSIQQAWVGDDVHAKSKVAHCVPVECFTNIFGTKSVEVTLGSTKVICSKAGQLLGPGLTRKPGEFFTFTPESISGLHGTITCPDPGKFCSHEVPDPPYVPPVYLAPYYQHEGAPVDNSLPNAVYITRVLVNGIKLCDAKCNVTIWERSRITVTIDGGPFHPTVVDNLKVGLGRDALCELSGFTPATLVRRKFTQRLVYNTTMPWWADGGDVPVHLCVALQHISVTQVTEIPQVTFFSAPRGVVELNTTGEGVVGSVQGATMSGWGLGTRSVYYSFTAYSSGRRMLVEGVSLSAATATMMLPVGVSYLEGRVHLFDGVDVSEWFAVEMVEVRTTGWGVVVEVGTMRDTIRGVSEEAYAKTTRGGGGEEVEKFAVVENMVEIMDVADEVVVAQRRHGVVLSDDVLHAAEVTATEIASKISFNVVSTMADVQDETITAAANSIVSYSNKFSRCGVAAADSGLATATALFTKITTESGLGDQSEISPAKVDTVLTAVDSVGTAVISNGGDSKISETLDGAAKSVVSKMVEGKKHQVVKRGFAVVGFPSNYTEGGLAVGEGDFLCSVTDVDPRFFQNTPIASTTVRTARLQAYNGSSPDTLPKGTTLDLPVDLNTTHHPTAEECLCNACQPTLITYTPKWLNPSTSQWDPITDHTTQNLTKICQELTSGVGSGWRAYVMSSQPGGGGRVKAVQIAEFTVEGGGTGGFKISNPGGSSLPGQTSAAAVDGDPTTSWVDYNSQALVVEFPERIEGVFRYGFTIPMTMSFRNPIRWRVDVSNGTDWKMLTGQFTDFQYQKNTRRYWFDVSPGLEAARGGFTHLRWTVTKQLNDVLVVALSRPGRVAAFLETQVIPSMNTEVFKFSSWRDAFTNITPEGKQICISFGVAYTVVFSMIAICMLLDYRSDKIVSEKTTRPQVRPWSPGLQSRVIKSSAWPHTMSGLPSTTSGNERRSSGYSSQDEVMSPRSLAVPSFVSKSSFQSGSSGGVVVMPRLSIRRKTVASTETAIPGVDCGDEETGSEGVGVLYAVQRKFREIFKEMRHHTWFTIMFREPHSTYTRAQRAVVLSTFMASSVFVAVLFFGNNNATSPLKLIMTALTASAIMAPTTILLRVLYQRSNLSPVAYTEFKADPMPYSPIVGEVTVYVREAFGMPNVDETSPPDVFYTAEWENKRFVSHTVWNSHDPGWGGGDQVLFPVRDLEGLLTVAVYDDGPRVEKIGCVTVSIETIMEELVDNGLGESAYYGGWKDVRLENTALQRKVPFKATPRLFIIAEYHAYANPIIVKRENAVTPSTRCHPDARRKAKWVSEIVSGLPPLSSPPRRRPSSPPPTPPPVTKLNDIRDHPLPYLRNAVVVLGVHGVVIGLTSQDDPLAIALYSTSAVGITVLSVFIPFGQTLLLTGLSIFTVGLIVAELSLGLVLLFVEVVLGLMGKFHTAHFLILPVGMVFLGVGVFVGLVVAAAEPPPGVVVVPAMVLAAWGVFPSYILFDYVMDLPFVGMTVFYCVFVLLVYIVIGEIDWEGKAVSSKTVWIITGAAAFFGLTIVASLRRILRGPIFPPHLPPHYKYYGHLLAFIVQTLAVFFSLVYLVRHADSGGPVFNGTLWTYWQDIFINEPLKIIILSQVGPITKTVMKAGLGKLVKVVLKGTGVTQALKALFG